MTKEMIRNGNNHSDLEYFKDVFSTVNSYFLDYLPLHSLPKRGADYVVAYSSGRCNLPLEGGPKSEDFSRTVILCETRSQTFD